MMLPAAGHPLEWRERSWARPENGEVLLRVKACGVCRTDLHVVDGELPDPALPCTPGHEVVGEIVAIGAGVEDLVIGARVGVPWLGFTCGTCEQCRAGRENLCPGARFTGYQRDGGYAEYLLADARYCLPLPESYSDAEAAPLLCAGLIGYRALRKAGDGRRLGLYGFGAAAHILAQVARYEGCEIYAFVRPGDDAALGFARSLGAAWAGPSDEVAPVPLDAAIIFAPVGALVPAALRAVRPGGRVVCAGIHMSDIPSFPYRWLWEEREIVSVANLTRQDGLAFLRLAPQIPIRTTVTTYPLREANAALSDLRSGHLQGAAVLQPPF
ncbi:zinc-dependent alcohol dehydrogenase family protein [Dongia sp.]|uniref:zinc-dependent alcohol dehydrogenase family protein n=1 Tax=Dongia sp. TaxID=1977262 RepID=UPI0035ADE431